MIDASEGEKAVEFAKLYCQEETADAQIYSKVTVNHELHYILDFRHV